MEAKDFAKPNKLCFAEDNNAWRPISTAHASILVPFGGHTHVSYVSSKNPGATAISLQEYTASRYGFQYLPSGGEWWINLPLAGSSAADVCYVVIDCGSPESAKILWDQLMIQGGAVDVVRWGGALLAAGTNWNDLVSDEQAVAARVRAAIVGRDGSQAANSRNQPVEARATTPGAASVAASLVGLLANSRSMVFSSGNDWRLLSGVDNPSNSSLIAALSVDMRKSGYEASLRGRRFVVTSEGGAITVSNGFTATAPRMTIEAGATNELIIRKIKLACLLAGTTNLQYRIVLDPDARYSSGGTSVTLGARTNMNGGSSATAGFTAHYGGITATATDADEREIDYGTIVNVTGNQVVLEYEDGLIVPASGTLLIYLMDAGGVGTIAAYVELEEANIQ